MTALPLGLIVPPASGAVPPDAAALYPQFDFIAEGLGLAEMSNQGYDSVIDLVGAAASRLAQRGAGIVALMGTSLSFYRGPAFNAALEAEIAQRSGLPALTMSSAVLQALRHVGASRIAVATAYKADVNTALRAFLLAQGFSVLSLEHLGITSIDAVHQVDPETVTTLGRKALAAAPAADALLISCGGLATRPAVAELETEFGKPVVTSPLAGLWATVIRAGLDPTAAGQGQLFA